MCETGSRLGFTYEILNEFFILGEFRSEDLDGDITVKESVFSFVNDGHSSFTGLLYEFISSGK
jgi:hypothetical protein